jgi:hypothetical protein
VAVDGLHLSLRGAGFLAGPHVRLAARGLAVAPGIAGTVRSARRFFPLDLGGETRSSPLAEGLGLIPVDAARGQVGKIGLGDSVPRPALDRRTSAIPHAAAVLLARDLRSIDPEVREVYPAGGNVQRRESSGVVDAGAVARTAAEGELSGWNLDHPLDGARLPRAHGKRRQR